MTAAYREILTALDVLASVEQKNVSVLGILIDLQKLPQNPLAYRRWPIGGPLDRRTYATFPIVEQPSANQRIYTTAAHRIGKVKSLDPLLGVRVSLD